MLLLSLVGLLFAGTAADTTDATFTGVNGATGFGYYVGPYYGALNDAPETLYCVDFANEVHFGQSWVANLTPLNGGLSNTRYGGLVDAQKLYWEAAWLTMQYADHSEAYADIQATIWQLFVPTAPAPISGSWLDLAAANYTTNRPAEVHDPDQPRPRDYDRPSPGVPHRPAATRAGTVFGHSLGNEFPCDSHLHEKAPCGSLHPQRGGLG